MSFFSIDCECDGPYPGDYSMVRFGAVVVREPLEETYDALLSPISGKWDPEALAVSGLTRENCIFGGIHPEIIMKNFAEWVEYKTVGKPIFITDNPAFDFAFMNFYFHKFYGKNPFGWSARRIGDIYAGMKMDTRAGWKHLREAPHNHDPVSDALGNAQAIVKIAGMGLKIDLT